MSLQFKAKDFVHLHLHSNYSLLQSAIQIKPLAKQLKILEMKACSITDFGNMYGAISFYNTMKENEIHPLIGYEAYLTLGSRFEREASIKAGEKPYYNLILLARDLEGYFNLAYLASKAYTEGFYHKPRIDLQLLSEKSKGLIALSSGFNGPVLHFLKQGNVSKAIENAKMLETVFGKGNFFIEIQDHNLVEEKKSLKDIVVLAKKANLPLVAANEAFLFNKGNVF